MRPTHKDEGCTWVGVGSKRSSFKPTIYWVSKSISQIRSPARHGLKRRIYRVCGSIFRFSLETITLPSADVQKAGGSGNQNREFGKVVRTTNQSPKLGKLWVESLICSNLLLCRHGPKPTIYWVWGSICAFRPVFPRRTGLNLAVSSPPSRRSNEN